MFGPNCGNTVRFVSIAVVVKKRAARLLIVRPRILKYRFELISCCPLALSQAVDDYLQLNVPITVSSGVVRVLSSSYGEFALHILLLFFLNCAKSTMPSGTHKLSLSQYVQTNKN